MSSVYEIEAVTTQEGEAVTYTLPSPEALRTAYLRVYGTPGEDAAARHALALEAVARLAIEHYRRELVAASGVDVEALAGACCGCKGDFHHEECFVPMNGDRIADAIRTAIARTERNRLAEAFIRGMQAGAEHPQDTGDGDAMYQRFRDWTSEGADR